MLNQIILRCFVGRARSKLNTQPGLPNLLICAAGFASVTPCPSGIFPPPVAHEMLVTRLRGRRKRSEDGKKKPWIVWYTDCAFPLCWIGCGQRLCWVKDKDQTDGLR